MKLSTPRKTHSVYVICANNKSWLNYKFCTVLWIDETSVRESFKVMCPNRYWHNLNGEWIKFDCISELNPKQYFIQNLNSFFSIGKCSFNISTRLVSLNILFKNSLGGKKIRFEIDCFSDNDINIWIDNLPPFFVILTVYYKIPWVNRFCWNEIIFSRWI